MRVGEIYLAVAGGLLLLSLLRDRGRTAQALLTAWKITLQVLPVLFFIFILMGTLQAFVPKETIAGLLGAKSGPGGVLLAEAVGCFALIQPAAVFPFSGYLLRSGASYAAIAGFVLTAILIGISTLPLEAKLLGIRFTAARNILTFGAAFLVALVIGWIL